jgi:hypothetical protein
MKFTPSKKKQLSLDINIPNDFVWKVLSHLGTDLGIAEDQEFCSIVRSRSIERLLDFCSQPLSRCIEKGDNDLEKIFAHYQIRSFLKKYPFPGDNKIRKLRAKEKFLSYERDMELFNAENFRSIISLSHRHPDFRNIVTEVRADIERLLGKAPTLDEIYRFAHHGPGVANDRLYTEGRVTCFYKFSRLPYSVTSELHDQAWEIINSDPRWIGALQDKYRREKSIPMHSPISLHDLCEFCLKVVDYSRVTTVPKTALIDRTIAIEPLLNVFFQLGIDGYIRPRLRRRWGYDLNDQTNNQKLAETGSINDDLVTLDLVGASEMVSTKIVEIYFPSDWVDLFHLLRCKTGKIDGHTFEYAKLSSMGNGFTFVVESVLFGALVRASIRRTRSVEISAVYGDDLIVPRTAANYLIQLLSLSGFSVNTDKSYFEGPFRESCGSDYFRGWNVRPVFLKKVPKTVVDLFYLYNVLIQRKLNQPWFFECNFSSTLNYLYKLIPSRYKMIVGPVSEELDTHLFQERTSFPRNKHGQVVFYQIRAIPRKFNSKEFFLRKMMVPLVPLERDYKWDRTLRTGNAFDITRRDHVTYKIAKTERYLPR